MERTQAELAKMCVVRKLIWSFFGGGMIRIVDQKRFFFVCGRFETIIHIDGTSSQDRSASKTTS